MKRLRLPSAVVAATAALVLVSPVLAASPATGQWSRIGPSVPTLFDTVTPGGFSSVQGSVVGPDGRLYFYGAFRNAGGDPTADNIAVYDPVTNGITGLGSNGLGDGAVSGTVYDAVFVGSTLYIGGSFQNTAGLVAADALAAWNGTSWSARVGTSGTVLSLDTRGGLLYVSGGFNDYGGVANADNVATWNGRNWSGFGVTPINNVVDQVLPLPDGRLFAVGRFVDAGGNPAADHAVQWDPSTSSWKSIAGAGTDFFTDDVYAIAVTGNRIVLGGAFLNAGGLPAADRVVEWTGSAWKAYVNTPGVAAVTSGVVAGLTTYGSNVVVSGSFTGAAGVANTAGLAVFNGSKWMAAGNPQAFNVGDAQIVGRTLYISTPDTTLGGGAVGIAAFGLPAPPTAPRSPHATAGIGKVTVGWLAPTSVNGSALRDYVVQYRRFGTSTWLTFVDGVGTSRSVTVPGLATGAKYQFRVRAKNNWGIGANSVVVTATAK